jgi:phosphohistidine phosphatase
MPKKLKKGLRCELFFRSNEQGKEIRMKVLYLLRHGKAGHPAGAVPDRERELLPRGIEETGKMCRKMVKKGMRPGVIITSTAKRAVETANVAAKELGYDPLQIETAEVIYGASADELGLFLRHQSDDREAVMLVGHNPGLEDLAQMLARDYSDHLPTGGIIALRLAIGSWQEIKPDCGRLITTLFP